MSSELCECECVHLCVYVHICQYLIIMFGKNCKLKHSLSAVIWPVFKLQMIGFALNSSEINATLTTLQFTCEAQCLLAE